MGDCECGSDWQFGKTPVVRVSPMDQNGGRCPAVTTSRSPGLNRDIQQSAASGEASITVGSGGVPLVWGLPPRCRTGVAASAHGGASSTPAPRPQVRIRLARTSGVS